MLLSDIDIAVLQNPFRFLYRWALVREMCYVSTRARCTPAACSTRVGERARTGAFARNQRGACQPLIGWTAPCDPPSPPTPGSPPLPAHQKGL